MAFRRSCVNGSDASGGVDSSSATDKGERMIDAPYWFGSIPDGCDVPGWVPYMTAAELSLEHPKLTIDLKTGETYVSFPAESEEADDTRASSDEAA